VEGKGRVFTLAEAHGLKPRREGGVGAMNLEIPLLRQWQHETYDP
jgi:hypothetical protein